MIDGTFVVNAIGHAYNLSEANVAGPTGMMVREGFYGLHSHWNPPDQQVSKAMFQTDQSPELFARTHFLESDVDVVVYHTLRLDSLFTDGLCSHAKNVELARRWPQRVVSYLGVDPTNGLEQCLREMDEQFAELPDAVGIKFYPDQVEPYRTWRMDDPELAFPIYEKALSLGLRSVAIHKALPNGPVPMGPYHIDDVEGAAMVFPQLNFEIVHAGMSFVEETAHALARFPNVYASLEITTLLLSKAPHLFDELMGQFLFWGGPSKILYSDGALFCHPQPVLHRFWDFQLSEATQAKYNLPPLSRADKDLMVGGNYARIAGIDVEARKAAIADDEWSRARAERGGLDAPFTAWNAEAGVGAGAR